MTLVDGEVMQEMELAKQILLESDVSVVVIKYGKIWEKKKGDGIKPLLEVIEEMDDIAGSVIGYRILGKAPALLCRYINAAGVYAPQGTKTAIARLILGNIPCQIDSIVPFIQNKNGDDVCPFEKMLEEIESPDEAYNLLKQKILENKK